MSFWFDPMVNTVGMPNNPGPGGNNIAATQAMSNQLAQQQAYVAAQNQAALAAARPTPYGYGFVGGYPSFGAPAAAGTYSPGSGRSSFSGVSLGGGGAQPSYGGWGGADDYLRDNPDVRQHAIDNALNEHDFAYQHATTMGANEGRNTYNAPRQYGWDANEGAPYPAAPQPWSMGEFKPQTYGWDHNEGAAVPAQPDFNDIWSGRGAQSLARDNLFNDYSGMMNPQPQAPDQSWLQQLYGRMGLPQPWTSPMSPNAGAGWGGFDSGMGVKAPQSSIWDTYGGADVQAAAAAAGRSMADFAPEHARNYGLNEGRGIFDSAAYFDKYQDVKNAGVDAYQHYLQFGKNEGREAPMTTNRDAIAALLAARGGGGYDMGAQSRAIQNPMNRVDWAQSYGTRGGANADMLRAAGGASPGYYNPQLDQLSRSTLGMNNQPVPYSHMFGADPSGYLGSQGRLNQDPFGGYVNPRDLDAGGSFPGNYQPHFDIPPGGNPFRGWEGSGA